MTDYLDGVLGPDDSALIEAHLGECDGGAGAGSSTRRIRAFHSGRRPVSVRRAKISSAGASTSAQTDPPNSVSRSDFVVMTMSVAGAARQVMGRVPHLHRQNGDVPADMLVGRRLATSALRSAVDAAAGGAGGV